jgi:Bifunctional DNA primase/polymerase, N-terminal./Primase C terminal 2 (PriCT-2).
MKKTELLRSFAENDIAVLLLKAIDPEYDSPVNGKQPLKSKWQASSVPDADDLEDMIEIVELSGCGYGVLVSNLLVIDVDARNGGVESYENLVQQFPEILGCGLIVETGSGGGSRHLYFKLDPSVRVSKNVKEYPGIDFKHSGMVVGPGSMHRSGRAYTVLSGSVEDIDEAPDGLVELLKPQAYERIQHDGEDMVVTDFLLKSALEHVTCYDDYHEWINIGMAIHHATNGDGLAIWDGWSSKSKEYSARDVNYKWGGFGKVGVAPVTAGTIFKLAADNGWKRPYDELENVVIPEAWYSWAYKEQAATEEFEAAVAAGDPIQEETRVDYRLAQIDNFPIPLDDIDITQPPGFAGELARWIDARCSKPRRYLSAMGAVYALSVIGGLRHAGTDGQNTRSNMIVIGSAQSASGKGPVLGAVRTIISAAGLGETTYGGITSEREMIDNLIEHQSANYVMDEIGDKLGNVSSTKANVASYNIGTIQAILDLFTKSGEDHPLNGKHRRDLRERIKAEYAQHQKRVEENEDENGYSARKLENLKARLNAESLNCPYLSIFGVTTPGQLRPTMNLHNASNGLLGRAFLCAEDDDHPRTRKNFSPPSMPMGMMMRICNIANGGDLEMYSMRVESPSNMVPIAYSKEAAALLETFNEWQENYAEFQEMEFGGPFGPIYNRMTEKAKKIALTLAMEEKIVTEEFARWAIAASWKDANSKIEMIKQYDPEYSKRVDIKDMLVKQITKKPGQAVGQICNGNRTLRDMDREKVNTILGILVKEGKVTAHVSVNSQTKQKVVKYHPK